MKAEIRRITQRHVKLFVVTALSLLAGWISLSAAVNPDNGWDPAADGKALRAKVAEISSGRSPEERRAALAAWKEREPDSAEPYTVSAAYEISLSRQPVLFYDFSTNGIPRTASPDGKEYSIRDLALPNLEAARQNAPEDGTVLFNLGQTYHYLGRDAETRRCLEKIIRLGREPGWWRWRDSFPARWSSHCLPSLEVRGTPATTTDYVSHTARRPPA